MLCYNGDVLMLSYNVRNFEWPPVYGTYRPILFFRIFRIACPPRTVNLTTARSDKKTPGKDQPERQTKMDKRNLTAGRENQVRRRTVHRQTSYRTGERPLSTGSYRRRASHHTLRLYKCKYNIRLLQHSIY